MHDLIIIGAGPAGLTASIYASCFNLEHIIIGKDVGGQMLLAPDILNYPGFEEISGKELTERMAEQVRRRAENIGVKEVLVREEVVRIKASKHQGIKTSSDHGNTKTQKHENTETQRGTRRDIRRSGIGGRILGDRGDQGDQGDQGNEGNSGFIVKTKSGKEYCGRAVILATGTERRKLNVPGETEYTGKGVLYCATCERQDYAGQVCGVVGGANSAVQAAVTLSAAADKVYLLYRGTELRGDPVWLEQIKKHPNIEVMYKTQVAEIVGDGERVTGVRLYTEDSTSLRGHSAPFLEDVPQHLFEEQKGAGSLGENSAMDNLNKGSDSTEFSTPLERAHSYPRSGLTGNDGDLKLDKLFIEIGGVPGTALMAPLGVKMDEGGYVHVNEKLETSVPGVFAAGDLVHYGLSIEQIATSVGLGARAAFSAYEYLKKETAPTAWGKSKIKRT